MAFKHLNSEQRQYIEIELKNGTSQNKIIAKKTRAFTELSVTGVRTQQGAAWLQAPAGSSYDPTATPEKTGLSS